MSLNIQLVVATKNLKIRKYHKLDYMQVMEGDTEQHSYLGSSQAEHKFNELKAQNKNVWWFYCPSESNTMSSAPIFKIWKEHLSPERIIEYNKQAAQQVVSVVNANETFEGHDEEFPIGYADDPIPDTIMVGNHAMYDDGEYLTFTTADWKSIPGRDKYEAVVFTTAAVSWKKDTELDLFRYKTQDIYYLRIHGTDKYQFIKPQELKALGYDFDSLYQPEQAT